MKRKLSQDLRKWSTPMRRALIAYLWGRTFIQNDLALSQKNMREEIRALVTYGVPEVLRLHLEVIEKYTQGTYGKNPK